MTFKKNQSVYFIYLGKIVYAEIREILDENTVKLEDIRYADGLSEDLLATHLMLERPTDILFNSYKEAKAVLDRK